MKQSAWHELPILLRYPVLWRQRLIPRLMNRGWRIGSPLATSYRRTVLRGTRIVAVVGSAGKTTTTRAISAALGYKLPRWYHRGYPNAYYSVGVRILETLPPTPRAVFEVGILYPGQMAPIADMLRPNITVVTSIGSDHLVNLGALEVTRSEKAEMVSILPSGGTAILNGDDPNVRWMADQTRAQVVTFGFDPSNDVWANDIRLNWPKGMQFRLHAFGNTRDVALRLLGRHMVYAILAAVAVALVEGLTLDAALRPLTSLEPTPGRLRPVPLEDGSIVLQDDTKGSVESVHAALDLLAEIPISRRATFLGDIVATGKEADTQCERLGERLAEVASTVIFVGDTPSIQGMLRGARHARLPPEQIIRASWTISEAARAIREHVEPGAVVLSKGRGAWRLERALLELQGKPVRCEIPECWWGIRCEYCPLLERGWAKQVKPDSTSRQ